MENTIVKFSQKSCCLSISTWKKGFIWLKILAFLFMLGSIFTPYWVKQGENSSYWTGSLLTCGGCDGMFENLPYSEITTICEDNNLNGFYKTFSNLRVSGIVYILFESVALLFQSIFIIFDLNFLKICTRKNTGIWLVGSSFFIHLIGTISWFLLTKAWFFENCEKSSGYGSEEKLCATYGPIIMITIVCMLGLLIPLHLCIGSLEGNINSVRRGKRLETVDGIISTRNAHNAF